MKTKQLVSIAVASVLPLAAFAQTPAAPAAPPQTPAAPAPPAPEAETEKTPKEPVTFLGVETSSIPSVVSEQLGLQKGFGLVVDYVVKEGPAEKAGVQKNDILKMLNDQILLEPDQLGKLIRSFPEGTNVTLTVLRKGQEQKITVRLGKKEVARRRDWGLFEHKLHGLEGLGKLKELEKLGELKNLEKLGDPENWNNFEFSFDSDGDGDSDDANVLRVRETVERAREAAERARADASRIREEAAQRREEARVRREEAREAARERREDARQRAEEMRARRSITSTNALTTTRIDMDNAEIFYSDHQGELKIAMVDGKKVLTAKDPQGRLVFSGPVETPEDVQKLPPEVKDRFEKLKTHELPAAIPLPPPAPAPPINGSDRDTVWQTTSVTGCAVQRVSLRSDSIARLMPAQKLML